MTYLFQLGRNPELSILEIVSYLKRTSKKHKIKKTTKDTLLIEIDNFNPKEISFLGGTQKIAEEVKDLNKILNQTISRLTTNKLTYAVNLIESSEEKKKQLIKEIKQCYKKEKIKALQKYSSEKEIPPSKSQNLNLELILFKNKLFLIKAASNPKEYKKRDENRPYFDPLKVTSLRLAKMLINLAQPKNNLLDPFIGLGTIAQEALLMNLNITGTDKDLPTVRKCRKNIQWLKNKFKIKNSARIIHSNVSKLSKIKNIDCIVTEPELGPYLRKIPREKEARQTASKLSKIYTIFLKEASKILKKGSKAVIIVPVFKTRENKTIRIGFESMLKSNDFQIYTPLKSIKIPVEYTLKRGKIRRKIYILEKLK